MILTDLLITTLLSASAVLGLQATAAPPRRCPFLQPATRELIWPLPGSQWFLFSRLPISSAQALLD